MLDQTRNQFTICPASKAEARDIAQLALIASDGLTGITWSAMRIGRETALDVGTRRAARETDGFSYRNAEVAFHKGNVIAAVVSFPILTENVADLDDEMPETFRPLAALEQQAVFTWNINLLATYPEARGLGAASALITEVEKRALSAGYERLSLIVRDQNPAQRLYQNFGFCEVAREPIIKGQLPLHGENWLLMVKALA